MAMHDWNGNGSSDSFDQFMDMKLSGGSGGGSGGSGGGGGNGPDCLGAIISAGLGFFLTAWISFKLLGNSDGATVLGMILWLPCSILAYIWLRKINFF